MGMKLTQRSAYDVQTALSDGSRHKLHHPSPFKSSVTHRSHLRKKIDSPESLSTAAENDRHVNNCFGFLHSRSRSSRPQCKDRLIVRCTKEFVFPETEHNIRKYGIDYCKHERGGACRCSFSWCKNFGRILEALSIAVSTPPTTPRTESNSADTVIAIHHCPTWKWIFSTRR